MRARLQEQQCKFIVILLPRHQPIGLDVALPLPLVVTFQRVRIILSRQRASGLKQIHPSVINFMLRPRFIQRLKSFLKRVEILTVYAICQSPISL